MNFHESISPGRFSLLTRLSHCADYNSNRSSGLRSNMQARKNGDLGRGGLRAKGYTSHTELTKMTLKACLIARDAVSNMRELFTTPSRIAFLAIRDCEKELDQIERYIDEHLPDAITQVSELEARKLLACLKFINRSGANRRPCAGGGSALAISSQSSTARHGWLSTDGCRLVR